MYLARSIISPTMYCRTGKFHDRKISRNSRNFPARENFLFYSIFPKTPNRLQYTTNANECSIKRSIGKLGHAQGPIFCPPPPNPDLDSHIIGPYACRNQPNPVPIPYMPLGIGSELIKKRKCFNLTIIIEGNQINFVLKPFSKKSFPSHNLIPSSSSLTTLQLLAYLYSTQNSNEIFLST